MNAHVLQFYRFMLWLSEKQSKPLAQLFWYTALMVEIDQHWRPEPLC